MLFIAQKQVNRLYKMGWLAPLLSDKTTNAHIIWATQIYNDLGVEYSYDHEITDEQLVKGTFQLKSRIEKVYEEQLERTKRHAEVFTPLWVVKKMNDFIEAQWFEREAVFNGGPVIFPEGKTWQDFVDSRRMEITCGEAPYLVTRYDASTGHEIPLTERVGILDRKLHVVSENTTEIDEWLTWVIRAYQATYGYEFQGDNLLLARLNLFLTFEDYMWEKFARLPTDNEYSQIVNVIVWNIWQMDGLTGLIPFCKESENDPQMDLFETSICKDANKKNVICRIYNWQAKCCEDFNKLMKD